MAGCLCKWSISHKGQNCWLPKKWVSLAHIWIMFLHILITYDSYHFSNCYMCFIFFPNQEITQLSGVTDSTTYSDNRRKLLCLERLEILEPPALVLTVKPGYLTQRAGTGQSVICGQEGFCYLRNPDVGNRWQKPMAIFSNLFPSPQMVFMT